jgi:hypothetical protein
MLGILLGLGLAAVFAVLLTRTEPVEPPVPAPVPVAAPRATEVRVHIAGLAGLPAQVRFAEELAPVVDGVASLQLPPGQHEGTWIVGAGCGEGCPGDECPEWCGAGTLAVEVPEGVEEPVSHELTVAPGTGRVTVSLPRLMDEVDRDGPFKKKRPVWYVEVRVDGRRGTMENHYTAVFRDVPPGHHEVVASVGGCPEAAWGCWPDGECPPKCRSGRASVDIPWGGASRRVRLRVPAPGSD